MNNKNKKYASIVKTFIVDSIEKKCTNILGCYNKTSLNKIQVLALAVDYGLSIPNTLVTNSLSELKSFFHANRNKIICKAIEEIVLYLDNNNLYRSLSKCIEEMDGIKENFGFTLFQEYIDKKYEVRVFYLSGKCYAIAIFSQQNAKTKTDFRNYDFENPNRMVPLNLPMKIKQGIIKLMKKIGLNTGSIDLLVDSHEEYYFLEINPIGQYEFVSSVGGYHLEFEIANKLIHEKES